MCFRGCAISRSRSAGHAFTYVTPILGSRMVASFVLSCFAILTKVVGSGCMNLYTNSGLFQRHSLKAYSGGKALLGPGGSASHILYLKRSCKERYPKVA